MPSRYKPSAMFAAPFDPERCAAAVPFGGRMMGSHQCSRKPWKDGWCKQHHPDSEAKRREESMRRYQAKFANSPTAKLVKVVEQRNALLAACKIAYGWLTETSDVEVGEVIDTLNDAIEKARR